MPKGIPLTEEEQQRRRMEIFKAASEVILEKGFYETSLQEIADAAGIGKSTLYDYFQSKEDILYTYFKNEIQTITERAQKIISQDANVSKKLKSIMRMHLGYLVDNKNYFLRFSLEAQRLSAQSQQRIQTLRYSYQDLLRELIEEGIQKGELRQINPLLAARNIFALLSLSVFATRPTGSPEEMLNDALLIFFEGIHV